MFTTLFKHTLLYFTPCMTHTLYTSHYTHTIQCNLHTHTHTHIHTPGPVDSSEMEDILLDKLERVEEEVKTLEGQLQCNPEIVKRMIEVQALESKLRQAQAAAAGDAQSNSTRTLTETRITRDILAAREQVCVCVCVCVWRVYKMCM
jgi:hypothetical protein